MANFSVEWLSKSYYEEITVPAKSAALHSKVHSENEEFTKDSRSQYSPTSPNNSCGYTSGSESEVGDDSEGEATQQRRLRTKFTSDQISKLEGTFSKHKYLGATQRRKIAEKLNLSETQVKTWFQNRRMKLKREVQDLRPEFLALPTALLPPVLFQHPVLSGQLPAGSAFYPQLQPLHGTVLHPAPLHQHRSQPVILPPRFY
ncbi:ventral expressed homeobox [Anabas testudineus]|uniref:ventral expressed homeobox n=1 Tax=Anabas testudineus TaxID=64144 RepID=UPI000E45D0A6|nr:ventral expressed homeobox [Anabas testudineus]